MDLNANTLIASLVWGSIGVGFFIYGKRQRSAIPLFGGILLVGISYFINSAAYMSLAGISLCAGIYFLRDYGR